MDKKKIEFSYIEIMGEKRITVILSDLSDMTQTRISAPGPRVDRKDVNAFINLLNNVTLRPSFWVLGGSLPPGIPEDTHKK